MRDRELYATILGLQAPWTVERVELDLESNPIVCRAVVPSGYRGQRGELWYARVLPPPVPGGSEHVVFTTPYVLLKPGIQEWQAYFRRTLPDGPKQVRIEANQRHMN
jgi:hypothetical protein